MSDPQTFIAQHTARVAPLHRAAALANWEVATTGLPEASERAAEAQRALRRVYAERDAFEQVQAWHARGHADPHVARILQQLYLAYKGGQDEEQTITTLTELMKEVYAIYINFRASYEGRAVSDNELSAVLRHETDSQKLRAAWEASKQVGQQVEARLLALVRARNAAAQRKGFANFYQQQLELSELSETLVFDLFDALERQTREPFCQAKAALDAELAQHFGVTVDALRPWHYFDPFFQAWPQLGEANLDAHFAAQDPVALAVRTFDGIGLEVRGILERSDLYERPRKNQGGFCTDIDRSGDTRILCNVVSDLRWSTTMLHELGHAVYNKYIDHELPYLLRTPPHSLSTEAIALLMGRLSSDEQWLQQIAGVPAESLAQKLPQLRAQERHRQLLFARWVFVMAHFERALYADPAQDLNTLWWELVERFQMLRRPEGRDAPDWAAKYHIANAPAMYHNYLLGELNASQLAHRLRADVGGLVDEPRAGAWLREQVFRHGATADWNETLRRATGEPLTTRAYIADFIAPA